MGALLGKHSSHKSESCLVPPAPQLPPHMNTRVCMYVCMYIIYLLRSWGRWVPLSILSAVWRWVQSDDVVVFWRLPDVLLPIAHEHRLLVSKTNEGSQASIATVI